MINKEIVDYIKKSFELKDQGFYKPAIEMLYKALALDSDNIEILAQLAYLYNLLGNYERAVYYIDKVLDINPSHLDCMLLLEEIYLQKGHLQLAKNISDKIYEVQPTNKNLAKKINLLNHLQDFDAIKDIEESLSDYDDDVLYELACAYNDNFDLQKSIELLEKGYQNNNQNEKIIFLLGKIYYNSKNFEKSVMFFQKLEKLINERKDQNFDPPMLAEVLNYLGLFKMNDKDLAKAIQYFLTAEKIDDKNPEYAYNLASVYFLNGWLNEALKCFNKAICLSPDNIDYHYSLAYLYYQKKEYDKASFELDFIKTIEQHHELSNVLSAMIISKKGDVLTARKQLENIVKYSQDDFAYYALSQIYKELSLLDLAKESILHALDSNPTSLEYLSEITEIELKQRNYEQALKYAQEILKINEKYVYAYIAIAKINFETKNIDETFDAAQKIIELDSNCPEGYYYNAIALFAQGDKDFAIESLKKSISLDLNNALLYIKMSEFYQDLGDFKTAYDWAKEASAIDERNYQYKWLCAKIAVALRNSDDALKYYSQSYRLGSFDKSLKKDYANYLTSIGKEKQAKKLLKI